MRTHMLISVLLLAALPGCDDGDRADVGQDGSPSSDSALDPDSRSSDGAIAADLDAARVDAAIAADDPQFGEPNNLVFVEETSLVGNYGYVGTNIYAYLRDNPEQLLTETARVGSCRLLTGESSFCKGCFGYCIEEVCHPYPVDRSAGKMFVGGLAVPIYMNWNPNGGYYDVSPEQRPDDLFDATTQITAEALGEEVAAFDATVTGVDSIAPVLGGECENEVQLLAGADTVITWPDPQPGARIRLRMPSVNSGHAQLPHAVIECEAADTGALHIPAELVAQFPTPHFGPGFGSTCNNDSCQGIDCPAATIARYAQQTVTAGDEQVSMRASSQILFYPIGIAAP